MVSCLRGEDGLLGVFSGMMRGTRMKTVLQRLFPRVFGGIGNKNDSSKVEVPGQQLGSQEDPTVKKQAPEMVMHADGFPAAKPWVESVQADAARKRSDEVYRWGRRR